MLSLASRLNWFMAQRSVTALGLSSGSQCSMSFSTCVCRNDHAHNGVMKMQPKRIQRENPFPHRSRFSKKCVILQELPCGSEYRTRLLAGTNFVP
jgi:hypothetical protein